ncbi:MAG: cupredoxin domain-containing protein [Candidatus Micrarchaeia archaeon]
MDKPRVALLLGISLSLAALVGGFAAPYLFGLSLLFLAAAISARKAGVVLLLALSLALPAFAHHTDAPSVHEATMDIRSGIPFPSEVSFARGEPARLRVFNHDEVPHTLVAPELGVVQRIEPGEEVLVAIPTERSGNFSFSCASYCGSRHYKLEGRIMIDSAVARVDDSLPRPFERIPESAFYPLSLAAFLLGLAVLAARRMLG